MGGMSTGSPYRQFQKTESELEMDIIRNRLTDLENVAGIARAWKRVSIAIISLCMLSGVTAYSYVNSMKNRVSEEISCKDTIIVASSDNMVSCPNSNQKMDLINARSTTTTGKEILTVNMACICHHNR